MNLESTSMSNILICLRRDSRTRGSAGSSTASFFLPSQQVIMCTIKWGYKLAWHLIRA